MPKAVCAWCGKDYIAQQSYVNRQIRLGKPTCCSRSCGKLWSAEHARLTKQRKIERETAALKLSDWMEGFDSGYIQGKYDQLNKELSCSGD